MRLNQITIRALAIVSILLFANSSAQGQTIWYVDDDGAAGNACTSWADACPELRKALSLATEGDQIWVAAGTYKPDFSLTTGKHTGDREATFQLINGVAIYGGFEGSESTLEQRAGLFDQTILNGNPEPEDQQRLANEGEMTEYVVWAPSREDRFNEVKVDDYSSASGNRRIASRSTAFVFTLIADTSAPFTSLRTPAINDPGTVTFRAIFDDGSEGIFTGDGGAITTVADSSTGPFDSFHNGPPDINNAGTVAFGATLTSGVFGMFSVWNGEITTIADNVGPLKSFFLFHTINNQGVVAFEAVFDSDDPPGPTGLFTGNGGPLTTIADTFGPLAGFAGSSINHQGTVAFRAKLDDDPSFEMVLTGNGGPFTTIVDESGPYSGFRIHLGINNHGTVAIVATLDDGSKSVITGDGGPLTTVVDASGPFTTFDRPTINDDGTVAFVGLLDSGEQGIFVGPDPVEDQVIRTGNCLFGSTVTGLTFAGGGRGLNNNGQIAFRASLEDGRRIIVRANPAFGFVADLDIKPGSCPNPFNRHGNGVLPAALVGTGEFDPAEVDLSTLQLSRSDGVGGSVSPNDGPPGPHSVFEDVASPFEGEVCECHDLGGDGIDDLSMKFRTDGMVETLELDALPGGSVVEIVLSGSLLDGTPFVARDCIVILLPGGMSPANAHVESNVVDTFVEVGPLDLNFDDDGFADFSRSYYGGTAMTLTAPAQSAGRRFVRWLVDDAPQPIGMRTIEVTVREDTTLKAAYARAARTTPEHPTEPDGPLE